MTPKPAKQNKTMSEKTDAPKRNPDLGVWTPAFVRWALENQNDVEFFASFKQGKKTAAMFAGLSYESDKMMTATEEKPEKAIRIEDFREMHHATFKAMYNLDSVGYQKLKDELNESE